MDVTKVLQTIKNHMQFKTSTIPGDIILAGMPSGVFYGVVTDIEPDTKKSWYHLKFKLLIVPPVDITWILRMPQMSGEIFTINGEEHFVIAVDLTGGIPDQVSAEAAAGAGSRMRGKLSLVKGSSTD